MATQGGERLGTTTAQNEVIVDLQGNNCLISIFANYYNDSEIANLLLNGYIETVLLLMTFKPRGLVINLSRTVWN